MNFFSNYIFRLWDWDKQALGIRYTYNVHTVNYPKYPVFFKGQNAGFSTQIHWVTLKNNCFFLSKRHFICLKLSVFVSLKYLCLQFICPCIMNNDYCTYTAIEQPSVCPILYYPFAIHIYVCDNKPYFFFYWIDLFWGYIFFLFATCTRTNCLYYYEYMYVHFLLVIFLHKLAYFLIFSCLKKTSEFIFVRMTFSYIFFIFFLYTIYLILSY